jgi:hypothetical protein
MMIQYRFLKETCAKIDASVKEEIDKTKKLRDDLQSEIEEAKKVVKHEEQERENLVGFGFKIFKYLRRHSLLLFNDGLKDYLDYLVSNVQSKADKTKDDKIKIKDLNELKIKHDEGMKMANSVKNDNVGEISLKDISIAENLMEMITRYQIKPNKYAKDRKDSQKIIRLKNV